MIAVNASGVHRTFFGIFGGVMNADPRYPIGQPDLSPSLNAETRKWRIRTLEAAPGKLRRTVEPLGSHVLDQCIRPEAWTIRQVVHHLADSQMHGYARFRWALTEPSSPIKTYDQDRWVNLPDIEQGPVGLSLRMLDGLHARWVFLLLKMKEEDFRQQVVHPEMGILNLDQLLSLYTWHIEHHIAQIKQRLAQKVVTVN